MNIRIEDPPANAGGSKYKALIQAAQAAGGAWVAVDRNELKDSPAQLVKRLADAGRRAGIEIEVTVATRTAHIRTIPAVAAQPASSIVSPGEADEESGTDAENDDDYERRADDARRLVEGDEGVAWAGFWRVVTELMGDCIMRHQTVAELAECRKLPRGLLSDGEWTPELRAHIQRQTELLEIAAQRFGWPAGHLSSMLQVFPPDNKGQGE
jgi:hypothetical protein